MTSALKSPLGRINLSNGPRTSHSLAWRSSRRDRSALRCTKGLSRTPEDEGCSCSSTSNRHLRYDDGAGARCPNHGGTCRGRACSVPCARANTSTSAVRERPAGSCAGDVHRPADGILRSSDADQEADPHLQEADGPGQERCRFQEVPGEAEETLSEKGKTRAWVHKPTLCLF